MVEGKRNGDVEKYKSFDNIKVQGTFGEENLCKTDTMQWPAYRQNTEKIQSRKEVQYMSNSSAR